MSNDQPITMQEAHTTLPYPSVSKTTLSVLQRLVDTGQVDLVPSLDHSGALREVSLVPRTHSTAPTEKRPYEAVEDAQRMPCTCCGLTALESPPGDWTTTLVPGSERLIPQDVVGYMTRDDVGNWHYEPVSGVYLTQAQIDGMLERAENGWLTGSVLSAPPTPLHVDSTSTDFTTLVPGSEEAE